MKGFCNSVVALWSFYGSWGNKVKVPLVNHETAKILEIVASLLCSAYRLLAATIFFNIRATKTSEKASTQDLIASPSAHRISSTIPKARISLNSCQTCGDVEKIRASLKDPT